MSASVILDFDGTLVKENSTRVLEEVIFSQHRGLRRPVVSWFFFGAGCRVVNGLVTLLRRITRRQIDWRFSLFLASLGDTTSIDFDKVIADTAASLTLNDGLLVRLKGVPELAVLSCGMTPVIQAFCESLPRKITLLAASSFFLDPQGARKTHLLEPGDKISFLLRRPDETYITDDGSEAQFVRDKLSGATGRAFNVSSEFGLFFVFSE